MKPTNDRDVQTREDKKLARDARHHWIYDTITIHKESRKRELTKWDYASRLYASKPTAEGDDTSITYYGVSDEVNDEALDSNELFAFLDQLVATVCPPNPEITIKARRRALTNAAKFRGLLINEIFDLEDLATKLWKAVGRACIYPRCYLKTKWSDKRQRPIVRVVNPHFIFQDEMAQEWDDLRYVCEVTMLTRGEFMSRVKRNARSRRGKYHLSDEMLRKVSFGEHREWMSQFDTSGMYNGMGNAGGDNGPKLAYEWVPVYEFYDLMSQTLYHFVEGIPDPVFESPLPYQLLKNPYHQIAFNDNLKNNLGLSDAELVQPTLDLLNDLSTLRLWHLRSSIPVPVIHEGLVDDPDDFANQYRNADGPGTIIRLAAMPKVAIGEVLGHTPVATLPIEWDSTMQQMLDIIERVLGLPGFARGQMGATDVATEAAMADDAVRTRNARRQRIVYLAIAWVAQSIIELFIEFMPQNSTIPMQIMDDAPEISVSRRLLGFSMPNEKGVVEADGPWDYKFEALAHNGDEDNRIVRLKNILELLPSMVQNPEINQTRMWEEILGSVRMEKIVNTPEEKQEAMAAMAPPPEEGAGEATPAAPDMSAQAMTPLGAENPQLTGAPIEGSPLPPA